MISGSVNSDLEAIVRTHFEDATGQIQAIDVKIDTGFTGFLSLPSVASRGLIPTIREGVRIGVGSTVDAQVHSAVVIWDGKSRPIDVHAMGVEQLIGMALLAGHDLAIRVRDGGAISITLAP